MTTFPRRPLLPGQVCSVGGPHRLVHLVGSGPLDNGDRLTRGGVEHNELVVGGRGRPAGSGPCQSGGLLIHGGRPAQLQGRRRAISVSEQKVAGESSRQEGDSRSLLAGSRARSTSRRYVDQHHQGQRKLVIGPSTNGDNSWVELRHLEYFLAVADSQSFTGAAKRLHVVQSGVSATIKALEREVGAELFVRGSAGVTLTLAGNALR